MKVTGIIAEYNPFHNGHKYHLDAARLLTGADYLVVVMSGDYTQRGFPAVADKYSRARMALQNGADLVLELPLPYASGSAEFFAEGAVALLDMLGVTDYLCFGSECGQTEALCETALLFAKESGQYRSLLQANQKKGQAFPAARKNALLSLFPHRPQLADILSSPNNILGTEYIKALVNRNSSIKPVTVQRSGAGYHDETLWSSFSSASALRRAMEDGVSAQELGHYLPESVSSLLAGGYGKTLPVFADDFSLLLHCKLLGETPDSLKRYLDVSGSLAGKICKTLPRFTTYTNFCAALKSRDLTYARICRCLLHILLGINTGQVLSFRENGPVYYARMLGFREDAAPLLRAVRQNAAVPLLSKLADAPGLLSGQGLSMLQKEITASHLYEAVISHKFHTVMQNEYTRQIVKL